MFYVQLEVKPDRIDEWRRAVDDVIERMSAEDAFVACYLHRDAHDACLFTLYERWREPSVEAFLANQMKPYEWLTTRSCLICCSGRARRRF